MQQFSYNQKSVRFDVPEGGMYGNLYASGKFYEHDFLQYIAGLNVEGVYLDIGGNIGNHSVFFAMFCKSTQVITFEPLTRFVTMINKHLALNHLLDKALVMPVGLSDQCDATQIEFNNRTENIVTSTLDTVMSVISLKQPIGLIKIDVEGMELNVLRGARETICKHRPILFTEMLDGSKQAEAYALLSEWGYQPTGRVFNPSPTYELVYRPCKDQV